MTGNEFERITPAQAGLDPRCIINMMDRMEKEDRYHKLCTTSSWKDSV